jgi:hypothetical protein
MIVVGNPIKPNVYEISSYNLTPSHPAQPSTGELMDELKAEIEKIPGATVEVYQTPTLPKP